MNIGATTGATLAFLAARYLLRDWVEQKFGSRLRPIQDGFAKNAFSYLVTLRLIPLFPFFLVNMVSGLTRISVSAYVAATAIGIIPGSFVYAYAGRQLGTINSLKEIASPNVLLAFTPAGTVGSGAGRLSENWRAGRDEEDVGARDDPQPRKRKPCRFNRQRGLSR
ncbi:MAG: hypothetical protein KatS3mg082_2084 [Nitrospiraceae bacterium]|nr:MAG: hypothetical protein KatS3mg082_2084 [Nitrospiraceae bacterium]